MSKKYIGGLITKTPVTPAGPYQTGAASGVWTLEQMQYYVKQGIWPIAGNSLPYIEDVFSTYLYTGNGSTQTITNGIDLSGKGGLVWIKSRAGNGWPHVLTDTVRGAGNSLSSDNTGASVNNINNLSSFNNNGFSLGAGAVPNSNTSTYVSWTFRKQPKFFDVVTYTGNGTSQNIAHNLGSVPGMMIVKSVGTVNQWSIYHKDLGPTYGMWFTSAGKDLDTYWNNTNPSATAFTVGPKDGTNASGVTYIAYLFAHDAGGFGASNNDNVISCGSYTGTGSSVSVTLGYEPQWVMIKRTDSTGNWVMLDNMRGTPYSQAPSDLYANTSGVEQQNFGSTSTGFITNPTGFGWNDGSLQINANGGTYIYIAIRRGPMKTPTTGTSVFSPQAGTGSNSSSGASIGFPADLFITASRNDTYGYYWYDRLRGSNGTSLLYMTSTATNGEASAVDNPQALGQNTIIFPSNGGWWNSSARNFSRLNFRRAPSFFDVVCYTGTGVARTINHNLGVVPEMMIVKSRSNGSEGWRVWQTSIAAINSGYVTELNGTDGLISSPGTFNSTAPTSTVFTVGNNPSSNGSGSTYVAYLFASCAGVSKVGSYTGTGTTQTINCGFTTGARFVMIKRTNSPGDWYVWDSARGIVAGNDPYLLMNSTAAEVTNTDYINTANAGFEISSTAPAAINANGGTFIYLAIA